MMLVYIQKRAFFPMIIFEQYQTAQKNRMLMMLTLVTSFITMASSVFIEMPLRASILLIICSLLVAIGAFFSWRVMSKAIFQLRMEYREADRVTKHSYISKNPDSFILDLCHWARMNELQIKYHDDSEVTGMLYLSFQSEDDLILFRMKWAS